MKALGLLCCGLLMMCAGELRAQAPATPPAAGDQDQRTADALRAIRDALKALPPGCDVDQIRKAVENLQQQVSGPLRARITAAGADLQMAKERAEWSARMFQKGYLTDSQAKADHARALQAEKTLEDLKATLKRPTPDQSATPRAVPLKKLDLILVEREDPSRARSEAAEIMVRIMAQAPLAVIKDDGSRANAQEISQELRTLRQHIERLEGRLAEMEKKLAR